jgi:hypothetical protein
LFHILPNKNASFIGCLFKHSCMFEPNPEAIFLQSFKSVNKRTQYN